MHLPRLSGAAASPTTSIARVLVLAAALLCAQWVGMLHRIDHAGGQAHLQAHGASEGSPAGPSSLSHSCAVFDGACLADCLPTALVGVLAVHRVHVLPSATGFASWQGRFFGHFQPRAPPAA